MKTHFTRAHAHAPASGSRPGAIALTLALACSACGLVSSDDSRVLAAATSVDAVNPANVGNSATIRDSASEWRILGAEQQPNRKLARSPESRWSVGDKTHEVLISTRAISNAHVLPFSDPVPNAQPGHLIRIVATPGEYEPASFVIRSGSAPLEETTIQLSDFKSETGENVLPSSSVDVRVVKSWYQSSAIMRRTFPRAPKILVSELLLHDDSLVRVDHDRQINLVRALPSIKDAERLLPFEVPARENRQVWLTIRVPHDATAGVYRSDLSIKADVSGTAIQHKLGIELEILPFALLPPTQDIGMFYLGRLNSSGQATLTARSKNRIQVTAEFADMLAHGVTTIGIDHDYQNHPDGTSDFSVLRQTLELLRVAGYEGNRLAYVDWRVTGYEQASSYARKLAALKAIAHSNGFDDVWVYNRDEEKLTVLRDSMHTLSTARQLGMRNIVALDPSDAQALANELDVAIVQHRTSVEQIRRLHRHGVRVFGYGTPHAAEEAPETTRRVYGFAIAAKRFDGVFSYAYQSGDCWDDWMRWEDSRYRPNVMAYPTAQAPIGTLQWEAWREAVDDLRYLASYLHRIGAQQHEQWPDWLVLSAERDEAHVTRHKIIQQMRATPGFGQ